MLGAKNMLKRITFSMIGARTTMDNGTQKFARSNIPISVSATPTKGIIYPVATIAPRKAIAGPGNSGEESGKNLVTPKNTHDNPSKMRMIVYVSLLLIHKRRICSL